MQISDNYSLLHHNTFHIPAEAKRFIQYDSVQELRTIVSDPEKYILYPLLHIGEGSNILFTENFPGTVLHSNIRYIKVVRQDKEYVEVKAGAGVNWDEFVSFCIRNNWAGTENLSRIPGEVGASAVQNIGAYGVEVKDIILEVETVEIQTGKIRIFKQEECGYSYRKSIFKGDLKGKYIVTGVLFRLSIGKQFNLSYGALEEEVKRKGEITLSTIRDAVISIRESKLPDPAEAGNAGSFFMNPVIPTPQFNELKEIYPDIPCYVIDENHIKVPAGWLIEKAGWKGWQEGNAAVHDKQALVLVNKGNATGQDILNLSRLITGSVKEKFLIDLCPEVNIL